MNQLFRFSFIVSVLVISFASCVDQDFDSPPSEPNLPDITPNTTIAELKARHIVGEFEEITDDVIIKGVVISDDQPGNFFRKLQIEDATGGIELAIDATELHNDYPVGREVFVKCQGLTLGDFAGFTQLGLGTVPSGSFTNTGRIPELVLGNYLIKGARGEAPVGTVVTIDDLAADPYDENLGRLITLENVEFAASSVGETYAIGGSSPQTVNLDITDCSGNTIILRTSGFSSFANQVVPSGNGNLTAVYTLFNSTRQLVIRDTTDVVFPNDPCLRGTGSGEIMDIAEIRTLFAGGTANVPADTKIKGIVISDRTTNNTNSQNLVIQDATAGITVRFTNDHNFNLGDEVEINVSGAELGEFRTLLQINNISVNVAEIKQTGLTPSSETLTVAELKADFENLESSLVTFEDVTLSGGGIFAGTVVLTDNTGSIDIFTFNNATFANSRVPTGSVTVTAIVSQFDDTEQLVLRDDSDVEGGMTGGPSEEMDIADLRALYMGSAMPAPFDKKIKGVVISDAGNENITGRNLVLQGADGSGIVVRFTDNHSFQMNDELEVELIGTELSDFSGLLQVNNTPIDNATKLGTGSIVPKQITINDLLAQADALESTLVKIIDTSITNSDGTYGGNSGTSTVTDATGTIPLYTRSQASFSGTAVPGGTVSITAIVSDFNGAQINLRSLDDIE